jgi:hypothetical protein
MIILYACLLLVLMHALLPGSDLPPLGQIPAASYLARMAGLGRADSRDLHLPDMGA